MGEMAGQWRITETAASKEGIRGETSLRDLSATHQTHVDLACVEGDEGWALDGGIDSTMGAMLIKTRAVR